jgi:hypothetical protein
VFLRVFTLFQHPGQGGAASEGGKMAFAEEAGQDDAAAEDQNALVTIFTSPRYLR